jgi:catechol-2,3-dioxygenase
LSTSIRPPPSGGIRHLALQVVDLAACEEFYVKLIGMKVEWRPDDDNVYLTSGNDNLALHRVAGPLQKNGQRLDHFGFILDTPAHVDQWYTHLAGNGVMMKSVVKQHRDGARSFYCEDPEGNSIQMLYHPPISQGTALLSSR